MTAPAQKRIVVFRVGSIGDTVVALPCFHTVRRAFPDAHITLLTNVPTSTKAAPLMMILGQDGSFVDDVIDYPGGLSSPLEAAKLALRLRRVGANTLVYMMPVRSAKGLKRDAMFFRLAGFRNILCIPKGEAQRVSRVDTHAGVVEPEAQRLARCLSPLGETDLRDRAQWDMRLSEAERAEGTRLAAQVPAPFLALNTGGKVASKDWGFDRWAELLARFRARTEAPGLMLVGAPDDADRAAALIEAWGDGGVSLCGGPNPREAAAALSHARLFLGHDSGPLHLAQCVGTPALGLFGDYNKPVQWHPIGSHVSVLHELQGIDAITVDQVLDRAFEMWTAQ
jgi:ADP-heptose:LPS heptosyltransferase